MRKLFFIGTCLFWVAILALAAGSAMAPDAKIKQPAQREPTYTMSEVSRHAVDTDCWMAIEGVVYNFTAYLPEHPTKPSVMLAWCGKEASVAFKTKTKGRPHSPQAIELLRAYRMGTLSTP